MNLTCACYWHTLALHFMLPPCKAQDQCLHTMHTLQYISPSLCHASVGYRSATCNTDNSMFVIPISARVACTIIACGRVGRRSASCVISAFFGAQISRTFTPQTTAFCLSCIQSLLRLMSLNKILHIYFVHAKILTIPLAYL